jgi:signal transduction histidine kinase
MFAPYQQLNVSSTQPASVGLGLTVARDLARLMGGDLEYHRRDRWNVFALRLPAAPATPMARAG